MAHKPRRDRRRTTQIAGSAATVAVNSETFEPDRPIAIDMETAPIGEVTTEMMDEAAHKAAEAVATTAFTLHGVGDEPAPKASVEPLRSNSRVFLAEPGPLTSPVIGYSPIGIEALATPLQGDVVTGHDMALSSTDAMGPLAAALEDSSTSNVAGTIAAEEAHVVFQGTTIPLPDLPKPPNEIGRFDKTPQPSLPSLGGSIGLINAQVIEMLASNMAETGQFLTALMSATSVTEVVAVNSHHLRRQMELITTQGRQMTTLARTIALDAMKPFGPSSTYYVRDR